MEIWVHPTCSKCRAATTALDEAGIEYTVRRYLDEPPTRTELATVLDRLGREPWEIARLREPVAEEIGLHQLPRDAEHRDRWLEALAEHPILIQRPILTATDGTTVVGREPAPLSRVIDAER